jgi:nucleoside-diphosphate-sugar epimerase
MGVKHFIQISSSAVLRPPVSGPIPEHQNPDPYEPYGLSKFLGESAVLKELEGSRTVVSILRPRTILGPDRGGLFDPLFRWIEMGVPVPIFGSGKDPYQFVFVDDFIAAIDLVGTKGIAGTFNLGNASYSSIAEDLEALIALAGSNSILVRFPAFPFRRLMLLASRLRFLPFGEYQVKTYGRSFYFEHSSLQKLGWTPTHSNVEALHSAYESYLVWSKRESRQNKGHLRTTMDTRMLDQVLKCLGKVWR